MLLLRTMFLRSLAAVILVVCLVISVGAQGTNVTITPDLRLFTTMAALNAAGFDVEFGSQYHSVREAVRKYASGVDEDLLSRLKAFYASHKGKGSDEDQLAKYISLAVNVSAAPNFKPLTRDEILPPDARSVVEFAELLREFYDKAHLSQHWIELQPDYNREISKMAPVLRNAIVRTDAYLRLPSGSMASSSMSIYIELAAPVNTVNVRSNQDSYYVIIGDSANPRIDDIRHAYLHFQLDRLMATNANRIQGGAQLLDLVKKEDGVDMTYTSEFHVMATESLIRALELRMDRVATARARESIDTFYRVGLLLTPYFYDALEDYEKGDVGIRDAFIEIARNVDLDAEQARFQRSFHKIPAPQKSVARPEVPLPPPAPPVNPARDLLKQAEAAFNAGDTDKAQAAFQRVLTEFDREDGSAMYGLALVASRKGDREEAKQYFERTVRSDSAESGMKVWSYVYLARIFDLECNRDTALENYRQAVRMADDTRNAQAAARAGIQKSFSDTCDK